MISNSFHHDSLAATIGREIQIIAGFKHLIPKAPKPESKTGESVEKNGASGLFDVIEEMEEKPIPTPLWVSKISDICYLVICYFILHSPLQWLWHCSLPAHWPNGDPWW